MAYGRNGDLAQADLASALAAYMRGDHPTARQLAARAKTRFPIGSPGWVKADDIVSSKAAEKAVKLILKGLQSMRFPLGLALAAGFMLTLGAPASQAQSISDAQRGDIEKIVREYLVQHPEVLQEAMEALEKKQAADEAAKHEAAVKENAQEIFNSPRQVTAGNPQGDVTFVEFFDYNCGYCKRAMTDMFDMMKDDPKLKVVLKEFPVLGPGSVEAARVAVAVRMQDKSGKKYMEFHQKLLGGRGQADKARAMAVAKEVGMDMARLDKDMASDEVRQTLETNLKLAEKLGLNGTPSYVIGSNVVVGAVGLDKLKENVNSARCGKATC